MPTTDDAALGVDIACPLDPNAPLPATPSGDLALVRGRENLSSSLHRRLRSAPGELLHRPQYGVGPQLVIETANTPAQRGQLAARIRRNYLRDPRVQDARIAVRQGFPGEGIPTPHVVTVQATVTLRHDSSSVILSMPLEV